MYEYGFTEKNLRRMVQFAEVLSELALIPLKDNLKRDFKDSFKCLPS
jgi:hypothetical protein